MALSIFMKTALRARGIGKTIGKIQKSRGYKPGTATVKLPKKKAHMLIREPHEPLKGIRKQQITGMKFVSEGHRGTGSLQMSPFKTPLQIKKQYAKVFQTSKVRKHINREKIFHKWIEKKGGLIVSKKELQGIKSLKNPKVMRRFGMALLKKQHLLPSSNRKKFIL